MSGSDKDLEVANEQAKQKLYSKTISERYDRRREGPQDAYLLGRVMLTDADPDLNDGSDFYIGEAHADIDDKRVFSWTAPVACTFFRGKRNRHEWHDKVVAVRAFRRRNGEIAGFEDQPFRDDAIEPYFPSPEFVPPHAATSSRPLPGQLPPGQPPAVLPSSQRPIPADGRKTEGEVDTGPVPANDLDLGVRAGRLLRAELEAPRGSGLAPVLATLQPDQYDLITAPGAASMIVEGQPGTGKTIIASHRAAYLISEGEGALRDGAVLLVGPTAGYTSHVRDVITRLTGGSNRVKVISVTDLMLRVLDWTSVPVGSATRSPEDVDWNLGLLARQAVSQAGQTATVQDAYEHLRQNGSAGHPLTVDRRWIKYLGELPSYSHAPSRRALMPLLACLSWRVPADLGRVRHIIVDEAQDVTPLEWFLLKAVSAETTWTLLGDLNQRRSDHTASSWSQVWSWLGIGGMEAPPIRLLRSYRSTRPILAYANQLLPNKEREFLAFQTGGPEPVVRKVSALELQAEIARQTDRLLAAYPTGTLAVISADPAGVRASLRSAGWSGTGLGSPAWERGGRSVIVLHPDEARGLEFDAVIVVEPIGFPKNFQKHGPLYTALTRPNRELAVVHSRALPESLRGGKS